VNLDNPNSSPVVRQLARIAYAMGKQFYIASHLYSCRYAMQLDKDVAEQFISGTVTELSRS